MSVKKIFLLICLLGISIPGMAAAEKWQDKDAEYCISFTIPKKGQPGFWQVDNYAFPFEIKDGFTVFDEAGKKYRFYFDIRKKLFIFAAPEKDNTKVYIYPSKKALEKIKKKRSFYVPDRYIRNWSWWRDQAASQAVNINILSYEPDLRAIAKAKADKIKAIARAKTKAEAEAKAAAKAVEKAVARSLAIYKTRAKVQAIEQAIAKARAIYNTRKVTETERKREIFTKQSNKKPEKVSTKKISKKKISKKKKKRLAKIGHLPAKDYPADNADLKKIFKYKQEQYRYRRNYRNTNITRKIHWRMKGKYVARIEAKLIVPKHGKYQFALKSNDLTQLYVNGKKALDIDQKSASTSKWRETKLFNISANPVLVEAYYRSTMDKTSIVIGWRAEGESHYKFITHKDYVDFNKVEPASLSGNKANNLPVIKYNMLGYFQNQKGRQFLLGFETNFPSKKIDWLLDGRIIDNGNKIMMTFTGKIPESIACVVDKAKPFKVRIPQDDLKIKANLLKRDLYIKINAPIFIYDDETLDFAAEFHSELQVDVKAFLEAKSNSKMFEGFRFSYNFKKTSNEELFRTRAFVKKYFKLYGEKLKNGVDLEFNITTSADNTKNSFYFDKKKIIFKKLSDCSDLRTENGHFVDSKGNMIIPILHRPSLEDKRSWSLLDVFPAIWSKQSILIISDDFGDKSKFSAELVKNAESNGQKLFFEDWNLKAFDADFINEGAKKINLIKNSKAVELIIIPSSYPIMRGISPRLQQRLLAALIQTARNNKNIRKITLTTPFPLAKAFSKNETMETIFKNIQHLVIEQEIGFMSLPKISADEETILSNTHPATKTKEYADIIVKQK